MSVNVACDHPVLVSKDYTGDLADSFADGGKKDDADALAEVFGDLHVGSNKCSVCQTECVGFKLCARW